MRVAYRDVRGVKVMKKGGNSALHRPCCHLYTNAIFILFKTELRISEFCGLTKEDIDFADNKIRIDHQLQRKEMK